MAEAIVPEVLSDLREALALLTDAERGEVLSELAELIEEDSLEWQRYPEHGAQADSPLIPTIIKQLAQSHGETAEFVGLRSVQVYCTRERWIALLMEVARQIYRED